MTADSKRNEAGARGFIAEIGVGVGDGALVGGDDVHASGEGGADVTDGGFAGRWVEGGEFDGDIGLGGIEESLDGFQARTEVRASGKAGWI